MNKLQAINLGRDLMNQHGLAHWRLCLDGAKRRAGQCRYKTKTISLSEHYVGLNPEVDVRNTILHEIAHALTPGAKHGEVWKNMCRKIGARPERCYNLDEVTMPKGRYQAACQNCKKIFYFHRMPRSTGHYHKDCGPKAGQLGTLQVSQ